MTTLLAFRGASTDRTEASCRFYVELLSSSNLSEEPWWLLLTAELAVEGEVTREEGLSPPVTSWCFLRVAIMRADFH